MHTKGGGSMKRTSKFILLFLSFILIFAFNSCSNDVNTDLTNNEINDEALKARKEELKKNYEYFIHPVTITSIGQIYGHSDYRNQTSLYEYQNYISLAYYGGCIHYEKIITKNKKLKEYLHIDPFWNDNNLSINKVRYKANGHIIIDGIECQKNDVVEVNHDGSNGIISVDVELIENTSIELVDFILSDSSKAILAIELGGLTLTYDFILLDDLFSFDDNHQISISENDSIVMESIVTNENTTSNLCSCYLKFYYDKIYCKLNFKYFYDNNSLDTYIESLNNYIIENNYIFYLNNNKRIVLALIVPEENIIIYYN